MPDPLLGRIQKLPPAAAADALLAPHRFDPYGAAHVRNELLAFAEEGSYYKAVNPTLGTGIAMGVQTSFSDTANALAVMVASASKQILLHYVRLICTAAGASSVSSHLAVVTDTVNRYSSGGTDLKAQAVNANTGVASATSLTALWFGAVTAAAVSAKRQIARSVLKTQAAPSWVVGDEVLLTFANLEGGAMGPVSGAAANAIAKTFGPVVLSGANHSLLLHLWNPSNATTPPSFEVEFAWWER